MRHPEVINRYVPIDILLVYGASGAQACSQKSLRGSWWLHIGFVRATRHSVRKFTNRLVLLTYTEMFDS